MRIGTVEIAGKALLAPMAGVTDFPFRTLCARMGAALTYTEMVSAKGLYYSPDKSVSLLANGQDGTPAAMQLFGHDPALLADMAQAYGAGYDVVDINMGCPVPKVVKSGQGSALMLQPELAGQIVRAIVDKIAQPVTVKIRKGWDERSVNAMDFAKRMADCGAAAIAVHGRTREQYYSGKADWTIIAAVKAAVGIPVIGSGDIFTAEDAKRMLDASGCDGVMVARGAQGNPWIFTEINTLLSSLPYTPPSIAQRLQVAWEHATQLLDYKPERVAIQEMRKHLSWYVKGISQAAQWRNKINSVSSYEELRQMIEQIVALYH